MDSSKIKQLNMSRFAALAKTSGEHAAAFAHVGQGDHEHVGLVSRILVDRYAPVPDHGLLVDVGCGPGRLARYMKHRPIRYIGTDLVPQLLAVAAQETGRQDWVFAEANGYNVPAPDNCADSICLLGVFTNMHPESSARLLIDAARAAKSGSKLLITYFDIRHHAHYFAKHVATFEKRIDPLGFLDDHLLKTMAELAGLSVDLIAPPAPVLLDRDEIALDGRVMSGTLAQVLSICVMSK